MDSKLDDKTENTSQTAEPQSEAKTGENAGEPAKEKTVEADIKRLYRLPSSGKIAGVCSGLAEYLDIDVTLLRVIFVVLAFASSGFWVLVYLILAIVMPVAGKDGRVQPRGKDVSDNLTNLAAEIRDSSATNRLRNYFGITLVLFGGWLLLGQFFPQWLRVSWSMIWPAALILFGLLLLASSRKQS